MTLNLVLIPLRNDKVSIGLKVTEKILQSAVLNMLSRSTRRAEAAVTCAIVLAHGPAHQFSTNDCFTTAHKIT